MRNRTHALCVLRSRCHDRRRSFVVLVIVDVFDIGRGGFGAFLDGLIRREILSEFYRTTQYTHLCVCFNSFQHSQTEGLV